MKQMTELDREGTTMETAKLIRTRAMKKLQLSFSSGVPVGITAVVRRIGLDAEQLHELAKISNMEQRNGGQRRD